jgi:ABC-type sulfate transport system substrate-binding protein
VKLFTIGDAVGGWQAAGRTHVAGGAIFDEIYKPSGK